MNEACLNGYHFYHSFLLGFQSIRKQREYLNEINVFPVADGDTGNNLVRTIKMIVNRLESDRSASKVLSSMASISLESARGNSGLIFSQYLNGLAINTDGKDALTIHEFAEAARKSVEMAYDAMETPVEGTILTVLNAWSDSIYQESRDRKPLGQVFEKALETAQKVLGNTKNQLKVLKDNDVIDAGALGVVSFLEGAEMIRYKGPVPISFRKTLNQSEYLSGIISTATRHSLRNRVTHRYCTEILLNRPRTSHKVLKEKLADKGDSLIISKGKEKDRIHIHTNYPWEVVDLLRKYGEVAEQKADDMIRQEQVMNNRLSKTAVLTDSIADISQEILDKYQVHVISLKILWDNEEYIDRVTITPGQFYRQPQQRSSFPGSSLPDEASVQSVYQYLLEHYENILVLSVGKSLSGTWNQMKKVAERFNRDKLRIAVLDTCLNSVAQGLLVKEVAIKAAEGKSFEELVSIAEALKKRIKIYVSVSTFKYMVKGGRVSPLKGFIARALRIKPIVSLDEKGKGKAMDKAFTRGQLMKKIARIIQNTEKEKGIESYAIVHADSEKKAGEFSVLLEGILKKAPDYISDISSVVGMHSGRGALAIGVVEKE